MNTTSISLISAIVLGLLAAIAIAFPVSAAEGGLGVSLDADTAVSADNGVTIDGSVNATTTTSADAEPVRPLTILRSSLTADTGTAPASAASVQTEDDLSAYTTAALRSDEHIDSVAYTDDAVEVSYYEPGRLLAVFPVTMKATARVAADGAVTVSYPWYRFLVASDSETNVSSTLETRASAWSAQASADATVSAAEKAALMDDIRAALATDASATVR